MGKVIAGITISLDGFVTGPDDRLGAGLGDGGEQLHYWIFGGPWTYDGGATGELSEVDAAFLGDFFGNSGAWIVGRTMHDVVEGWGDDPGFGTTVVVVTHRPHENVVKGDTTFEFVADGIGAALERAREIAGDKDVVVMGGADVLRQCLDAGVVEELTLTIAPVLLGRGKPLFDGSQRTDLRFERFDVVESPYATHVRYRVS
jgi:dihydrofolate reductase